MREEQHSNLWGKVVIVLTVLGAIASIVTCATGVLPAPSCAPELSPSAVNDSATPVNDSPTPNPTSTPVFFPLNTPNSRESLESMLEAAKRVRGSTAQGQALRIVAQHAVRMSDYNIAIDAGQSTASSIASSETLAFVAVCAAKEAEFEFATKAAKEIPSTSVHDKTTIEILKIKGEQEAHQQTGSYQAKQGPTPSPEGCP